MGESELFSDQKSDFERSYRSEILVAGLPAPEDQIFGVWRSQWRVFRLLKPNIALGQGGRAKKPSLELTAELSVDEERMDEDRMDEFLPKWESSTLKSTLPVSREISTT